MPAIPFCRRILKIYKQSTRSILSGQKLCPHFLAMVTSTLPCQPFVIDIIDHTLEVFDSSASRNDEDYCERLEGEIDSQHFPKFPLRRKCAFYEKTCNVEDKNSLKFMCEKDFPSHSTLTPGLLIMTCACPKKIVYGFTLMTSGESPQMIFGLILSRFPTDYSPNIIYDNACKAKGRVQKTKRKFLMAFSMGWS